MNPLMMLLLVIVSTGLACPALAIERNPGATAAAVEANGTPGAAILILAATAPVTELGSPAAANYRLASAAAVQYAAADGSRIGVRAAADSRGVTAPRMVEGRAAPAGSRSPAAAMPEPATWMQLLCGLVIAGFIARRRTNVGAG